MIIIQGLSFLETIRVTWWYPSSLLIIVTCCPRLHTISKKE